MEILFVVDMQNDFVKEGGSLYSEEGAAIIDPIREKINSMDEVDLVVFTKDTHKEDYLSTREGRYLPIPHCQKNTYGWEIEKTLTQGLVSGIKIIEKSEFSLDASQVPYCMKDADKVSIVGVCTDICVVSIALYLRSLFPEINITVYEDCCAGSAPENHEAALKVMKSCHIDIVKFREEGE